MTISFAKVLYRWHDVLWPIRHCCKGMFHVLSCIIYLNSIMMQKHLLKILIFILWSIIHLAAFFFIMTHKLVDLVPLFSNPVRTIYGTIWKTKIIFIYIHVIFSIGRILNFILILLHVQLETYMLIKHALNAQRLG